MQLRLGEHPTYERNGSDEISAQLARPGRTHNALWVSRFEAKARPLPPTKIGHTPSRGLPSRWPTADAGSVHTRISSALFGRPPTQAPAARGWRHQPAKSSKQQPESAAR